MRRPQSKNYVIVATFLVALTLVIMWLLYQSWNHISHLSGVNTSSQPSPTVIPAVEVPALSYENLFDDRSLEGLDESKLSVVVATGDIIPARGVDAQIRRHGPDYPFLGAGIESLLTEAHLTIASLEAPIIVNCPVHNEGFTFCGQASFAKAMARVGIDMAALENNHIGNYGPSGISETVQHLQESKIDYADRQRLAVREINGLTFGLLSFNGITATPILDQQALSAITEAKKEVDVLIVAVHWGKEYQLVPVNDPGVAPENPLQISRQLIDAGADLIIGNHPHWPQGFELYKGKLIAYAHGNFIFDQSWSLETSQGFVGRYTFYNKQLVKVEAVPIQIANQAQPYILDGQAGQAVIDKIRQSTDLIRTAR